MNYQTNWVKRICGFIIDGLKAQHIAPITYSATPSERIDPKRREIQNAVLAVLEEVLMPSTPRSVGYYTKASEYCPIELLPEFQSGLKRNGLPILNSAEIREMTFGEIVDRAVSENKTSITAAPKAIRNARL